MRTRSYSNLVGESSPNLTTLNPKRRNRRRLKQPFNLEEPLENQAPPVVTMADQRTMAELLRAPTEGYAEAIVVPPILAEHFELKHSLINMMTSDQFFGLEKDNPHDHIRWFNKITSTIKYKDVPNSTIKLMLFPFSLAGAARRWLEKEPPRSILTWEDLVSKFINEFFPPSRTTNLRNEISNFEQRFGESFHEAWDRYKDLLRACPHHGFTELHQLDTFYNALNLTDQDSLNSAAGGNLLERSTRDVLMIIENKSKVHNSRNKSIVSQVKSSDVNSSSPSEIAKLTHAVNQQTSAVTTAMTAILKQFQATPPPASVKAVEEICVTYGGAHPYYQCLTADGNTFRDNIQGYVSAAAVNYNQGNSGYRPPGVANQTRPSGFAQPNVQNNQNRFSQPQGYNRGNNFNQDTSYQAPTQQNQVVPLTSMSNQTNELKNMMASFFQMNTASTSGTGSLPSNTIANPKGDMKAITTRSGLVLDGPSVPMPPPFINPEEDKRVEETLIDPELAEDPLHPNIPYPSRMHQEKQQENDEVQIHKFWQMFKQLHINISLADALILIPKYQKMLKSLLSNKEKLLELANTPLNENCSTVILKKLPEKLGDPGKFLISCGFSELKCKVLADLGASINLIPLSVWKKLGLPELISTRMTLELANREICTPVGIARDVFVPVGKFTFPADFIIVDYESDPRVPLILGRPFLRTARALIDVHGEEMILRDGLVSILDPIVSSSPTLTSLEESDLIWEEFEAYLASDSFPPGSDDTDFDPEGDLRLIEELLNNDPSSPLPLSHNPLSGSTTSSSPDHLLEEFADELALITFPPGNDDLPFDIESDLREIEYLLNHDPTKEMDSILEDSVDEGNLADPNNDLVDTIPEMFTDEHTLDYSSPPLYDDVDDDLVELKSDNDDVYDDPFDSKEDKIKESKLLIDELDPPRSSDFLPSPKCDSVLYEDFSEVDALPSTNNEDKVFNPAILIHENLFEVTIRVTPDKNVKKLSSSNASLILEDFNPPLYELPFHKEVPRIAWIFEVSRARSFCPSITRASHPQLHFRNPISKSYRLTFILDHT
ncbi:reverse transcriptase domain-containing protein [Tanacetum coccineum]